MKYEIEVTPEQIEIVTAILEFLGIKESTLEDEQLNEDDVSKVVISIQGGVIQNITTNKQPNCVIVIADYDAESSEENNGIIHEDINGKEYVSGYFAIPEINKDYVDDIFVSLSHEITDISKQQALSAKHLVN